MKSSCDPTSSGVVRSDFQCHRLYCASFFEPDTCVRMEGVRVYDGAVCGTGYVCSAGYCRPAVNSTVSTSGPNPFNYGYWKGCPKGCSNNGLCDIKTGLCECDSGWTASDCAINDSGVWNSSATGSNTTANRTLNGFDFHYFVVNASAGTQLVILVRGTADCDVFISNITLNPTLNNYTWSGTDAGVDERVIFTIPSQNTGRIAFGVTTGQPTGASYTVSVAAANTLMELDAIAPIAATVSPTPSGNAPPTPKSDLSSASSYLASMTLIVILTVSSMLLM